MTELIDSAQCNRDAFNAYRSILKKAGRLSCRILSDSMHPLISAGETVNIAPVPELGELRRFDIIVFLYGDRLYCHYVWSMWENPVQIQTRSLKECRSDDLPTLPDFLLGKVIDQKIGIRTRIWIILLNWFKGTA